MRRFINRSLFMLILVGLMIILAACGGGSTSPTTNSTGTTSASPTSSTSNTTPTGSSSPGTSTISFTASGGLSGNFAWSISFASNSNQLISKTLTIIGVTSSMSIDIAINPYTGPGTYTLTNKIFSSDQKAIIDIQQGTKVWGGFVRLTPTWTCALSISSESPASINFEGQMFTNYHEIKGSFSCPMLISALGTDPPVNMSNGQFDVFAKTGQA